MTCLRALNRWGSPMIANTWEHTKWPKTWYCPNPPVCWKTPTDGFYLRFGLFDTSVHIMGAEGEQRDVASLLTHFVARRHPFKKAADGKKKLPVGVRVLGRGTLLQDNR